ncbi:hypothetical protein GLA29479_5180 [Lysobacter antibioticus]|nr:hypothetical protein GLA29479_5180 [Lysobacter antibioticus]
MYVYARSLRNPGRFISRLDAVESTSLLSGLLSFSDPKGQEPR